MRDKETITIPLNKVSYEYLEALTIEQQTQLFVKDKEIERLKKREQECIDHYLVSCKYASEMESKYISANYVINELEKWLKEKQILYGINNQGFSWGVCGDALDKLQELKGVDSMPECRLSTIASIGITTTICGCAPRPTVAT